MEKERFYEDNELKFKVEYLNGKRNGIKEKNMMKKGN